MKKPLVYFLAAVTTAYIGSASTNVSAIFDWNDVTFSIQDQDEASEVVVVPETTDDGKVINEVYLEDDPGIKKVVLPDTVNEVEVIRCTGITEFSVSENNPYLSVVDGILYDKEQKTLMCYPAGRTDTEFHIPETVEVVGKCAFAGVETLEKVYIPSSVRKIENSAFAEMKAKEFIFSEGVTDIEKYAFYECTELEKITLPASLERIERPFEGCTNLNEIIILHTDYKGNGPSATIDPKKDYYLGLLYDCENAIVYVPDEGYDTYLAEVIRDENNLQKISEYPYKKAYELSVNETEIALEEGQTYKLNVSLDNRFFYNESLVITSDHGDIAQVSKDGTITAVSAGKAVITAKAKLRDPDDPADNVRYVSVTVNVAPPKTLTAEQVSALENLKNKGSITIGSFGRQEMIIRGEIASDTPRITYDEVINIIDASEFKKYEDILRRINNIHGAPDYSGGSGTTRVEYWLDDKGNEKISMYTDVTGTRYFSWIFFSRCDESGTVMHSEIIFPEKSDIPTDTGIKDYVYCVYNSVEDEPVKASVGDIDGSGKIDVTDLTELSLYLLGDRELTENQQKSADVDSDGAVTLADLARLQQYLSKKITSF